MIGLHQSECMNPKCPDCDSDSWKVGVSQSGFQCYKCKSCGKKFNERVATPFHWLHFPNKVVMMVSVLHAEYRLSSYRVAEILRFNGVKVSPRSIRRWPHRFRPLMKELLKRYKIELSQTSPSERGKWGRRKWSHKMELLDSEGNVVISYLAPEQSAREIERALKREKRTIFSFTRL